MRWLPALLLCLISLDARGGEPGDTVVAKKLLQRAQKAELDLFTDWRNEWRNLRDLRQTYVRFGSLHCHYDDYDRSDIRLIHDYHSRKSMCPIWFEGGGTRGDESLNIDFALQDKSRAKIRAKRAFVIRLLDSLAIARPKDAWVLGQRVRLNVDQRDFARAADIISEDCRESQAACAALQGFVFASAGEWNAARVAYDFALSAMNVTERCSFLDISLLLPPSDRDKYLEMPCARRDSIDTRYWWLADPLFSEPGNERLYAHLYRQTWVAMHASLLADEHYDWRPQFGGYSAVEMIVRYGLPAVQFYQRIENDNHNGWLGFRDMTANSSREYFIPRFHTAPPFDVASGARPLTMYDIDDLSPPWDSLKTLWDEEWWPFEHYRRPGGGALKSMRLQAAAFRRADGPLLAVAAGPRTPLVRPQDFGDYTAMLLTSRSARDSIVSSRQPARLTRAGAVPMTLAGRRGEQIVAAEIVRPERDSATAVRARLQMTLPPGLDSLRRGDVALSDPAFFLATLSDDSIPRGFDAALERMLPTVDLLNPQRIGVFAELYGVAQGDPVELTLTVLSEDQPGFFRRLGARIGVADLPGGSFVVRWRDDQPGTASSATTIGDVVVQSRAIVLNIGSLKSGKYALEIGAARPGRDAVISRREFTVKR